MSALHPQSVIEIPAAQQTAAAGLLLPMGGGYNELMPGLAAALYARCPTGQLRVAVLPASFSSNPLSISAEERARNLQMAECRRLAIETALGAAAPAGGSCSATLVPICTRADAENRRNLALFGPDLHGAFLLGGDQAVAMQVLAGTPVEAALCDLHRRGGLIAGTSAGAAMQSHTMLAGYIDNLDAPHPLEHGITSIWDRPHARGLAFGQPGIIIDQHFFQRGRLGRLLEAIVRPDAPHVGVGIDAFTGLHIDDERLSNVFGCYAVAVLDAESLGAAQTVRYCGERKAVSVRNVLVHLLAPGPFSYDLAARRHSLAAGLSQPPQRCKLGVPPGAGSLLLSGGAGKPPADPAVQRRFLGAIGADGPLLVAALDAQHEGAAQQCAQSLARNLAQSTSRRVDLVHGYDCLAERLHSTGAYAGIVAAGGEGKEVEAEHLRALTDTWKAGTALWLAGAAAALAGRWRSGPLLQVHEHDPQQMAQVRAPLQTAARQRRGLGLLPIAVEPRVLEECRWARLFALAYEHANAPALALGAGTTLAVTPRGAEVLGEGTVFALDLSRATLTLGANSAYVVANGLLDAFAVGDEVTPCAS